MGLEYFGGPRTLNGLVVEDQTFAVASSGTDFGIVSSGTTHTFNLPSASASNRGLVTTGTQTFAGAKTFSSDVTATGFKSGNGGLFFPSGYTVLRDYSGNNVFGIHVTANTPICSTNGYGIGSNYYTPDVILVRDLANILAQRNSTSAQTFRIYSTYTSSTNNEFLQLRAVAGNNFEIGTQNGSGGGTLRGLTIGKYLNGSSTITPWITIQNDGLCTFSSDIIASSVTSENSYYIYDTVGDKYKYISASDNSFYLLDADTDEYCDIQSGAYTGDKFYIRASTKNISASDYPDFQIYARTFNFESGSSTSDYRQSRFCQLTLTAASAFTVTNGATVCIDGPIIAGTNVTITNNYALKINTGISYFGGNTVFSKAVYQSSEITNTPSGTTQTLTLNNGNHQTLDLSSATGSVTATLTVPSNACAGTIIVKQHASAAKGITWAVSAGTIKWLGTEPTWGSDGVGSYRVISWRYNGSIMFLMSTDVG